MRFSNDTNITSGNDSTTNTVDLTQTDFGLASTLIESAMFCIAMTACVLNVLVFQTVTRVRENKLRVKFLLQNSIASDIVLALSIGTRVILKVLSNIGLNPATTNLCGKLFYMTVGYFSGFYQVISSLAVSIDRLYSICRPLVYVSRKYSRFEKTMVIGTILCLSTALTLPIVLLRLSPGDSLFNACRSAFGQSFWSESVLPFLLLSGVCLTIAMYSTIFLLVLWYRRHQLENLSEGQDGGGNSSQQASISITFFLIHLTYIILYVPGMLYFSFLGQHLDYQPELNFYLSQFLITWYLLNTIVDPLVFIFRISFVRARFQTLCCSGTTKRFSSDSFGENKPESSSYSKSQITTIDLPSLSQKN